MIGVYKITSPIGKIYVGKSININKRIESYRRHNCVSQPKLYKSFIEFGFNRHTFEVLEECDAFDLNHRERYWQLFYQCVSDDGLNCILSLGKNDSNLKASKYYLKLNANELHDLSIKLKKILQNMEKYKFSKRLGITRPTLNTRLEKGNWKKGEIAIIKQIAV